MRPRVASLSVTCFALNPASTNTRTVGVSKSAQLPALPLPPDRTPATVLRYTQRYTTILEDEIRAHPAEWLWIHRRWKDQPGPGDVIATSEPAVRDPA